MKCDRSPQAGSRLAAFALVVLVGSCATGSPEDHLERARELFGDVSLPQADLKRETGDLVARELEGEHRRASSRALAAQMAVGSREWRELEARLDHELRKVVEQSPADERLRQWGIAFSAVHLLAGLAADLHQMAKPAAGGSMPAGAPGAEPDGMDGMNEGRGSTHAAAVGTREVLVLTCGSPGTCNELRIREAINALGAESGAAGTPIFNELLERVEGMDSVGCGGAFGPGCVALTDQFSLSYSREIHRVPARWEALTPAPPSDWKEAVYRTLDHLVDEAPGAAREVASLVLDVTPGAAQVKSAVEAATGKDPITGSLVPLPVATAGFLAANVPFGKVFVKLGAPQAWRMGASALTRRLTKLGFAGPPSVQAPRVVYRPKRGRVVVLHDGEEVVDVINRYTHYTTVSGAEGILKRGTIEARKRGKVYAVASDERVLSRVGARRLGARDGRGVVQFNLSGAQEAAVTRRWREDAGVWEYVIPGDVELMDGATVLIRN